MVFYSASSSRRKFLNGRVDGESTSIQPLFLLERTTDLFANYTTKDKSNLSNTTSIKKTRKFRPLQINQQRNYTSTFLSWLTTVAVITLLLIVLPDKTVFAASTASQSSSSHTSTTGKRSSSLDSKSLSHADIKSGVYDNQITGEPEIECGFGVVHFRIFTTKGHASAVFVRGQAVNPDCVFHNTRNVTIELAKCKIRRKREVNPSGVAYQMTVVVQMHPLFLTKVDRAYNVNCFYMERRQDVNVEFGVSDITTQMVQMDATLPTCTYSVHRDSPNGPLVKYTKVGEQLYHVWECPSKMYSMLLYNCVAIDGKGSEYAIIDENGCTKDEFLMPQISYTADNTKAMAASDAFNFPDRNTMSFSCKIRLCYNHECNALTPPKCITASGAKPKTDSNENLLEDLDNDQLYVSSTPSTLAPTNKFTHLPVTKDNFKETVSTASAELFSSVTSAETTTIEPEETIETTIETRSTRVTSSPTTRSGGGPSSTELALEEEDAEQTPLPADFPRPSTLLLQQDDPLLANGGSGEGLEDVIATPAQPSRFVKKTVASKFNRHLDLEDSSEFLQSEPELQGTTPPVKILQRPSASKAASANAKNSATMNRQQRDTALPTSAKAPIPTKASARRSVAAQPSQFVDLDVNSPELTILDDNNLEPGTAERLSSFLASSPSPHDFNEYKTNFQRDSALYDFNNYQGAVCLSPAVLALAGGLLTLLIVALAFIIIKSRKTIHSFN